MRRRSERKKSSSPAPLPARRSRRSRKISENEKVAENAVENAVDVKSPAKETVIIEEPNADKTERERGSSDEHVAPAASPVRKSRSTRTTPKKRNTSISNQRDKSHDNKVETIPEEAENGAEVHVASASGETENKPEPLENEQNSVKVVEPAIQKEEEVTEEPEAVKPETQKEVESPKNIKEQEDPDANGDKPKEGSKRSKEEVKVAGSLGFTASKDEEQLKTTSDVLDIQTEDVEERNTGSVEEAANDKQKKINNNNAKSLKTDEHKENHKEETIVTESVAKEQPENNDNDKNETNLNPRCVRKRKWFSKKVAERAPPVLAISTDSLKNIIADVVKPVPLSDVQLESSSEEEGLVTSDHESEERSLTPEMRVGKEQEQTNETDDEATKPQASLKHTTDKDAPLTVPPAAESAPKTSSVARSPSPARNHTSHVLYITNLVRPFTVLQLKGLLARTGKIVDDNGFWIDRIKSKCFVAYATEDEAIETRHALHGVRWPVSNPKCLNVDFGSRTDMDRAIQSTQNDAPKYPHDNTRDNQHAGNTWSRLDASDIKAARPVREWDVGKKEPNDREKSINDRRRSSKERVDARLGERGRGGDDADRAGQERKRSRERERSGRDRIDQHGRSRSGSPATKSRKKENEPPVRLLDDLFRKTKSTPCIYWLPLTPEAIAEKEAFRQKRIEEHKQRIKEREERMKERDREKDRDRQRDTRRRSNERRRSRSRERERRRY
ncbi:apoptotic chromatin condensation inducer in the nucleus [Drosophila busckii]|uniref:apoptotic chromatin condensation inducer in the nucleus n=1 Tax=Drosophila busckii TaxID=30019 RepID=UPI001432CB54|nr:apoptotic chromatin condensation inducer in the nucleus [Drosophila busckii]